ncbi:MAG: hypothetical protein KDD44_15045, partial [Bdellovibrionales bacterium]|nr:hypothetical protein [Bdellovibrionales bacterium]
MADNLQTCWVGLDATTNRRPVLFDAAAATRTDLLQLLSRQRSRPIGTHGPYATPHHSFFLNVWAAESNDLLTVRIVPASGCILHRANPAQHPQGFDAGTAQLRVRSAQFQLRRSELALFSNPARRFGGELSFDVDSTPNERQQDYSPECYASVCRDGRGEIQLLIGHRAGNEPAVFPHSSLLELLTLPDRALRPADAFDASEYSTVRRWSQEREVHGVVLMFTIEDFFAVGAKQRSFRRLTI